jgi:glutathione synthase
VRLRAPYAVSTLDLAFIVDPLASLKAYKDSSVAMMRAAAARGHRLHFLEPQDLYLRERRLLARVTPLELTGDAERWYRTGQPATGPLAGYDAVLMRKDPPFDSEYLYATHLLELAEAQGARVINAPRALRDFNEKLALAQFPDFAPPTLVTRDERLLREFLAEHGDIVLKPLDGMGGSGVFRVHATDHNVGVIIETVTHYGRRTIMAQRYLPEIRDGDKRVLLIDGVPVPYALARIPRSGEHRGNLAAGGTGVARALTARDREIAQALGPVLRDRGLTLVGLDVIGDWLTEVNVTSPTGMQELHEQTGCDPAAAMIDAVERLVAARR